MATVGTDFLRCPNCGPVCDFDEEKSTDTLLVIYCHRCGAEGEIPRLRVNEIPVNWKDGADVNRAGRKEITGKIAVSGGHTMAGSTWIRVEGPRDEVIGALSPTIQEDAKRLIWQFEDA